MQANLRPTKHNDVFATGNDISQLSHIPKSQNYQQQQNNKNVLRCRYLRQVHYIFNLFILGGFLKYLFIIKNAYFSFRKKKRMPHLWLVKAEKAVILYWMTTWKVNNFWKAYIQEKQGRHAPEDKYFFLFLSGLFIYHLLTSEFRFQWLHSVVEYAASCSVF